MIYIATSLFDEKSEQFTVPQFEQNEATARRNFAFALEKNPSLAFAAQDLRLYNVGSFDTENGSFLPEAIPSLIADGKEFIKNE